MDFSAIGVLLLLLLAKIVSILCRYILCERLQTVWKPIIFPCIYTGNIVSGCSNSAPLTETISIGRFGSIE